MSAEIIGREAIAAAARGDGELRAHADPTGASDRPISEEEAGDLLGENPALVYLGPRKLPPTTEEIGVFSAEELNVAQAGGIELGLITLAWRLKADGREVLIVHGAGEGGHAAITVWHRDSTILRGVQLPAESTREAVIRITGVPS